MEKVENIPQAKLLVTEPWLVEKVRPATVFDLETIGRKQVQYLEMLTTAATPVITDLKNTKNLPFDYNASVFASEVRNVHRLVSFVDMVNTAKETVRQADSERIAIFFQGVGSLWGHYHNHPQDRFTNSDLLMAWMVQYYARKAGKFVSMIETEDDALIVSQKTTVIMIDDCAYSGLQVSDKMITLRNSLGRINPHKVIVALAGCTREALRIIDHTADYMGIRPIIIVQRYIPCAEEIVGKETMSVLKNLPYAVSKKYNGRRNTGDIYRLDRGYSTITWFKVPDRVSLHPLFVQFENEVFLAQPERRYPSPNELEAMLELLEAA